MKRILHLVHRDPHGSDDLTTCRRVCRAGDAVVLRGTAVVAALTNAPGDALESGVEWYVMAPDLALHGMAARALRDGVVPIDYPGFVDLVCEYELCQSW